MTSDQSPEAFQFSYLPYFPSENVDLSVRRLHLFSFWQHKDKYIADERVRNRIEEMCRLYFEVDFNPHNETGLKRLDTITIAVIDDNYAFTPSTPEQLRDLRQYTRALAVCCLLENDEEGNRLHSNRISEHFTTFHQNLDLTSTGMTYWSGSYIHNRQTAEVDQVKLVSPLFIPSVLHQAYDHRLFGSLSNMIDTHNPDDQSFDQVFNWINYAFTNAEGFSYPTRSVMMATAFEIFFDLPHFGKTDEFAGRLEALLEVDRMPVYDDKFNEVEPSLPKIKKQNSLGKEKENTMYGWWARDFYDLRSKVVHGTTITDADIRNHNGVDHLIIASSIMRFCLYRQMEERGYISYETDPTFGKVERHMIYADFRRKIEAAIQ